MIKITTDAKRIKGRNMFLGYFLLGLDDCPHMKRKKSKVIKVGSTACQMCKYSTDNIPVIDYRNDRISIYCNHPMNDRVK